MNVNTLYALIAASGVLFGFLVYKVINPAKAPKPSLAFPKQHEPDQWERRRMREKVEAHTRSIGKARTHLISIGGVEHHAYLDRPTWMFVLNDGHVIHRNDESVDVIKMIYRDEAILAELMAVLEAMLKSEKVKYEVVQKGMGATCPSLTTMTAYGVSGPSLVCDWDLLYMTNNGPSVEITEEEHEAIKARMVAHGKIDFKMDAYKMYELL